MLVPLREAAPGSCGAKAATLGALLRAGLPVPDGGVVPFVMQRREGARFPVGAVPGSRGQSAGERPVRDGPRADLRAMVVEDLGAIADVPVAVRSSASGEDSVASSAAGRYDTVLGVQGADAIADAIRRCWASLTSARALDPSAPAVPDADAASPSMAVIIQPLVDAEVAGVLFAPSRPDGTTRIEASWGLGAAVVGGEVTPDVYEVASEETVTARIADKRRRIDRVGEHTIAREVPAAQRTAPSLEPEGAVELARLGQEVAALLGGPQDIEWALSGDGYQILQARPITAELPPAAAGPASSGMRGLPDEHGSSGEHGPSGERRPSGERGLRGGSELHGEHGLQGTPGSAGCITGPARIVRGPEDFSRVRAGDVLICPWTDPAWTPLLRLVAGIVTEVGGALSHAAIIAREQRIPAVLGVTGATSMLRDGQSIAIDGATGTLDLDPGGSAR